MKKKRMSTTQDIALGFLIIIIVGTLLLMLPWATRDGEGANFLTALFTATSSGCVVGLVVVDTWTNWTIFGQTVLLILIQIGGLGFMTVGVFFSIILRKKITLKTRGMLQESINVLQVGGIIRLAKKIVTGTAIIEGTGAILLSIRFVPIFGWARGIFYGIFHSISAFCNAGFDLLGSREQYSSFVTMNDDVLVNIVLMLLIIIGGIGFIVWDDISTKGLHFKKYMLHTKLVLVMTAVLIFGSAILFYIFERNNTFADMSTGDSIIASLFSSVTARTAGFNTVDTGALTNSSKLLTIFLMFIGGSPGSTAGGIKTVTMLVLILYMWSNLRNNKGCYIFGRRISDDAIKKASTVILISLGMAIIAATAICAIQDIKMEDVLFEVFSAIGTVGMTTGVTRDLTTASRIIIIILMYCGRIGSMSFAMSFTEKKKVAPVQLPTEKIIVG